MKEVKPKVRSIFKSAELKRDEEPQGGGRGEGERPAGSRCPINREAIVAEKRGEPTLNPGA